MKPNVNYTSSYFPLLQANILVDSRGRACLSDFGLSKIRFHSSTRTRKIAGKQQSADGTARWMSPESMMLGIVNKKSDIYSFGMTMYEVNLYSPLYCVAC